MTSILVVDDCSVDRRLVGGLLRCVPEWQVSFADNGQQALQKLEKQLPDVIVTDLQMPLVDGLELVRIVKARYPDLPVVLITAKESNENAVAALRAGAANYTPKSQLARDLVANLKHVLGISDRVHQALAADKPLPQCEVSFELENDDKLIGRLIEYLQSNLPPWADADRIQIAMALHEAIVNAMHHGNLEVGSELRDNCESSYYRTIQLRKKQTEFAHRRVRIQARYRSDEVSFCIQDEGPGFNPCDVSDPREPCNLEKLSGRGLLLIHSFMDEVVHNPQGNCITMIKRNRHPGTRK